VRHDEARELTAFDRVRPDDLPGRGKRRRGPPRGDVNGNVLTPDKPRRKKKRKNKRGVAPGQELPSVRTWFAGDNSPGGRQNRGGPGRGKNRGGRGGSGHRPGNNRGGNGSSGS
jgi:23S rRNA pseudouridine2605 synthase